MTRKISLEAARVDAELSQDDVAKKLSAYLGKTVTRQRVSAMERNPSEVTIKTAEFLLGLYNMTMDDVDFSRTKVN